MVFLVAKRNGLARDSSEFCSISLTTSCIVASAIHASCRTQTVHILLIRAIHICNHHHASWLPLPTHCLLLVYLTKPSTQAACHRPRCHLTASTPRATEKRTYTSSRRTSSPKPKRKHLVGSRGHGRSMLSSSPTAARRSVSQYIPPLDSLLHPRSAQQTPFLTFAPTGRAMVSKATGPEGRCLGLPCRFGAATSRERTRHPES